MVAPKPHTLDVLAGLVCSLMGRGPHRDHWFARSFDLKSANRQCAAHQSSKMFWYIIVGDPRSRQLRAFRLKALPIGSVKSVHSFMRVAHSLWAILTSLFLVISTNYFDDFVSLAAEPELSSVEFTVKAVFKLPGWKFAQHGRKAPRF